MIDDVELVEMLVNLIDLALFFFDFVEKVFVFSD